MIAGALMLGGCDSLVDSDVGAGIGAQCEVDDDCQASQCFKKPDQNNNELGICTIGCESDGDCVEGTTCTAFGVCELPLGAGFIFEGLTDQDQWSFSNDIGRRFAEQDLSYLSTEVLDNVSGDGSVSEAINTLVANGNRVIFLDSSKTNAIVRSKAEENPGVTFYVAGDGFGNANLNAYYGRMYQAYYVAGVVAGNTTITGRIGFVAAHANPETVAMVNAFHLGARSVDRADLATPIETEVSWAVGDPSEDPIGPVVSIEVRETEGLLDRGADVITHSLTTGVVERTVQTSGSAQTFALATNLADACEGTVDGEPLTKCIGATSWNWGPLFRRLIDRVQRENRPFGNNFLERFDTDPTRSTFYFQLKSPDGGLQNDVDDLIRGFAQEELSVFAAGAVPIRSTGQCGDPANGNVCIQAGDALDDDGLRGMCWHVEGIVRRVDCGVDLGFLPQPALVPYRDRCSLAEDATEVTPEDVCANAVQ